MKKFGILQWLKVFNERIWPYIPAIMLFLFITRNFEATFSLARAFPELPLIPLMIFSIIPSLFVIILFIIRVKQKKGQIYIN